MDDDALGNEIIGSDFNVNPQSAAQSFDDFSHSLGDVDVNLWEGIRSNNLNQSFSTGSCSQNMVMNELFQSSNFSSTSDNAARPGLDSYSPRRSSSAIRPSIDVMDENGTSSNTPLQARSAGDYSITNDLTSIENTSRQSATTMSTNDVRHYATQILDLHRRSTREADRYMASKYSATSGSVEEKPHSDDDRVAASRHFITTLLSDSQAFLAILRQMQSCIRASVGHSSIQSSRSATIQVEGRSLPREEGAQFREPFSRCLFTDDISATKAVDFQSSLTAVSYYAYLTHAYDVVLKDILNIIAEVTAPEKSTAKLLQHIPDVHLGHVRLIDQPHFQIESLLNACSIFLESIGASLGLGAMAASNSLLDGVEQQRLLLGTLLCQSDLAVEKADGTRESRVKHTIDQIRCMVKQGLK